MEHYLVKYRLEVAEFLDVETLRKIDYGILDLSKVKNYELKDVLLYLEELLTVELMLNYMVSNTGIFRVRIIKDRYCYDEFGQVIEADSIAELRELVLAEKKIWYVFDDILAGELAETHH